MSERVLFMNNVNDFEKKMYKINACLSESHKMANRRKAMEMVLTIAA